MIPKECKRLAEVDFPIAVVSKHAAREKSIRHGHPSTLHLWWARRPLAACRAMLLGLLLPDPCDPHCPEDFKEKARELLPKVLGRVGAKDEELRKALLKFIGDFSNWDLSSDRTFLEVGRRLVKAAHPEETPLVVDPFAGGGSIPLEALRLGCETFASDLNPVACLILKVMLEDIPRWGNKKVKVKRQNGQEMEAEGLAEALRILGKDIKEAAEKELKEFYPDDPDGSTPIAYLWARTVRCESPNCGAEIPLVRSFWLCKKANRRRALRYKVVTPKDEPPHVEFEIFEPKVENEIPNGTVTRAKATCLSCGTVVPPERVRSQLAAQQGGADVVFDGKGARIGGARLLAVVNSKPGETGRHYRLPTEHDCHVILKAQKRLQEILGEWDRNGRKDICPVPDEPMNTQSATTVAGRGYGFTRWGQLFTARQKLSLATLVKRTLHFGVRSSELMVPQEIAGLAVSRFSDICNAFCRWESTKTQVRNLFARQAIPMLWDFAEPDIFGDNAGNYQVTLETMAKVIERLAICDNIGQVQQADACSSPLPDRGATVWFTDPPYYDAIAYADLSDFFFVWLKRIFPGHWWLRDPFDMNNPLTPKAAEIIQDLSRKADNGVKDRKYFEKKMSSAFAEGHRILCNEGVGCVVFAHKTTEGWEALLSGMILGGWVITGSWPITTELGNRIRAHESASLAASVHLVCRPRPEEAPIGDWGEVLRELPKRVGDWIERLQSEGIRGADLVFACIGPALEIFSRYSKVETAEGRDVKLAEFLEKVWEVVGRIALEQILGTTEAKARNGLAGALEEDARLTALFLWTLQSTNGEGKSQKEKEKTEEIEEAEIEDGEEEKPKKKKPGFSLIFDVVRRFAQPLGIHLPEWEGRIIETEKGVVRLLSIQERAKALFGEDGAQAVADRLESSREPQAQLMLFPQLKKEEIPKIKARKKKSGGDVSDDALKSRREATTLDRVHAAMLLQSNGRANALRAFLKDQQERGPDFLRLANALSALYPKESEEKRLLDAMLLAMPR